MKYTIVLGLSLLSTTSFAFNKADLKNAGGPVLAEQILNASEATYLDTSAIYPDFYYQNKKGSGYLRVTTMEQLDDPYCKMDSDLSEETKNLLAKTPLESLKENYTGEGYWHYYLNDTPIMMCKNIGRERFPIMMEKLFPTVIKKSAIRVLGVDKKVELVGLTDEEKPEAIVKIGGNEEMVPCNDLLFDHAKFGDVETGMAALTNDMTSIVKVLAIGPSLAKVQQEDKTIKVIPAKNLIAVDDKINSAIVYVLGKGVGQFKAYTKENGKLKYVVSIGGKFSIINSEDYTHIFEQGSVFTKGDPAFLKVGDKRERVTVHGSTAAHLGNQQVIIEKNGKLVAVPVAEIVKITRK